jgi:hypothetical protein
MKLNFYENIVMIMSVTRVYTTHKCKSVVRLTAAKVLASYISCVGACLVQCCDYLHVHCFVLLLRVACTILLYNHISMEV